MQHCMNRVGLCQAPLPLLKIVVDNLCKKCKLRKIREREKDSITLVLMDLRLASGKQTRIAAN